MDVSITKKLGLHFLIVKGQGNVYSCQAINNRFLTLQCPNIVLNWWKVREGRACYFGRRWALELIRLSSFDNPSGLC